MGLVYNKDAEAKTLYSAYGYTVNGKVMKYEWTIRNGEREDCITELSIVDADNAEIFKTYLGNNVIFTKTFEKYINSLLWWIAHDKPDSCSVEDVLYKSFVNNSDFFDRRIQNRKKVVEREEKMRASALENKKAEAETLDKIQEYCRRKNLHMVNVWTKIYLLKIHDKKAVDVIDNMSGDRLESILNGNFKEFSVVKVGTLDELGSYIK